MPILRPCKCRFHLGFSLVTKVRDSGKDFNGLSSSGNSNSESIWSDGTTMWAADVIDAKVYAYDMATKARVPRKDFDTLRAAGNGTPRGLWSDRVTLWVGDWRDGKIYAYDMATKARLPSNDFDTPGTVGNNAVEGLRSDGTTMWVTDHHDRKLYAYDMTTKARVVDKEFNTLASAGNQSPDGIWSDGITMWVADSDDGKLYAYKAPASVQAQQFLGTPTGLSAAPGSEAGEVVLCWTPAANATVHWVYLQKADGTDGRYWETSLAGDANTATITGLQAGETYRFWVQAGQAQADGTTQRSEWSNAVDAVAGEASMTASSAAPDLVVRSASVSGSNVAAGGSFTFSATVYNRGDGTASATTLRYYRSTDSTVDTNDTAVDSDQVISLDPDEDDDESERLTAPSSAGTYYYWACVDPVYRENRTPTTTARPA